MIAGQVQNGEAMIELGVSNPTGSSQRIEAILDTGFNGHLTLPSHVVATLQLPLLGRRPGVLADGSMLLVGVYVARVIWHGRSKDVLIVQTDGQPLLGMELLEGSRLTMDVIDGGDVTIEELPSQHGTP